MAITNLGNLKAKALLYMKDRSDLSDYIGDGVSMATDYFSQRLRVREMMSFATLTPTDNVCALPTDFIELISVTEDTSFAGPLDQITDIGAGSAYSASSAGLGINYKVSGSSLRLYPASSNGVGILYYAKIPPLVEETDTNWLLDKFPNLYLDYCRMFAADIAEDPNEAKYGAKVDAFLDMLNERHQTAMYARVTTDLSNEMVVP